MNQVYLAVGPFCWGKADDIETAIKRAKYNWVRAYSGKPSRNKFKVYLFLVPEDLEDSGIYVSQDGAMRWNKKVERIEIKMYPDKGELDETRKLEPKKAF
jgi:hypothetical protein